MLQAVLDTNFWLATHVVCITLGYATTYLAGLLGILFIVRGVFTSSLKDDVRKDLTRMIYGVLCFALFFSFVGTVLGGLWADCEGIQIPGRIFIQPEEVEFQFEARSWP